MRHLRRRFEVPFRIHRQQTACLKERGLVFETSEDIEYFALRQLSVTDAIGRDQGQFQRLRDLNSGLISDFFGTVEVTLQFHEDVVMAEQIDLTLNGFAA